MSGIDSNFVSKYIELKNSGGKLTNDEVKGLVKDVVDASGNDPKALDSLKNEIFNDGRIDENESKLLFMIGFASDSVETTSYDQIKSHLMPANDDRVSDLMSKGFSKGKAAVKSYEDSSPYKSSIRNYGSIATFGLVDNADKAVKYNNKGVLDKMDGTLKSLETSSQKTDCVKSALNSLGIKSNFGENGEVVSEKSLNDATGVTDKAKNGWDAISPNQYNKAGKNSGLQSILKNSDGKPVKALVIVGAHAYKFEGFDKSGNILAKDPSDGNKSVVIQKNNPSVTVYVQKNNGKGGDGAVSNRVNIDANGLTFEQMKKNPVSNSSDVKDKTGESLNVRKLLVLVGDKTINPVDRKAIFDLIKSGKPSDLINLQKLLKTKGIDIDPQELKAFKSVMNSSVKGEDGKNTTMIKELEKLTSTSTNQDRANYSNGVVYSDISLKDYFTETSPQTIFNTFQDMIHGRDGC